jgi:hypothetical protein
LIDLFVFASPADNTGKTNRSKKKLNAYSTSWLNPKNSLSDEATPEKYR